MDPVFAAGLRDSLARYAQSAPRRRRRAGWWWGIGAVLVAVLAGGGAAFASQLWVQPGDDVHADLATPVLVNEVGTVTVPLGARPKGASEVYLEFFPHDAGTYWWGPGGASESVTDFDVEQSVGKTGNDPTNRLVSSYYMRLQDLDPGRTSLTITTSDPTLRWSATMTWVSSHTTPWGVNARGQTYGMQNTHGTPDLIAAIATNGAEGYIYSKDLDDADGTSAARSFHSPQDALDWQKKHQGQTTRIPVYDADGTTKIGTFCIGTRC